MANLSRVLITKPKGATVTLTRRATDSSNTVAITVNKNSRVTVQDEAAALVPPVATMTSWAAGAWKDGAWRVGAWR